MKDRLGTRALRLIGGVAFATVGLRRLCRWGPAYASSPYRIRIAGATVSTWNLDTLSWSLREVFLQQSYEVGNLPAGARIVDVGANMGISSLYFLRRHLGSTVLAVEPDDHAFALLTSLAGQFRERLSVLQCAAASQNGRINLHREPNKPGKLTASINPGAGRVQHIEVRAQRLSELLAGFVVVDLLKMDVEGAETEILHDLIVTGTVRRIHRIVLEVHPGPVEAERVEELLDRAGFRYEEQPGTRSESDGTYLLHAVNCSPATDGR
ncbi:FkbM family methyltransferase [Nonomuraea sp. MG754425]|uniref:FkbM family methyltransferase n=1 Tax=Nonomuraea sp. MG754425 TaxID=2570319 RepID=UPI001F0086FE|nr:FkbM family methyltransferase [Nonomuraea sp. MG754425]